MILSDTYHLVQNKMNVGLPVFSTTGFHSPLLISNPSADGGGIFLLNKPRKGMGFPGLSCFLVLSTKSVSSKLQHPVCGNLKKTTQLSNELWEASSVS